MVIVHDDTHSDDYNGDDDEKFLFLFSYLKIKLHANGKGEITLRR